MPTVWVRVPPPVIMRYFKPKKDLEYSCLLLPQKIKNNKKYKYINYHNYKYWQETDYDEVSQKLLDKNFIEVDTAEEAIEGY